MLRGLFFQKRPEIYYPGPRHFRGPGIPDLGPRNNGRLDALWPSARIIPCRREPAIDNPKKEQIFLAHRPEMLSARLVPGENLRALWAPSLFLADGSEAE